MKTLLASIALLALVGCPSSLIPTLDACEHVKYERIGKLDAGANITFEAKQCRG